MKTKLQQFIALALLVMGSLFNTSTAAPLGTAFTYQGRLYEGHVPANGEYVFQFGLFDRIEGGVNLGNFPAIGPALVVPVTNGLFTTTLDFGASAFRGEARFLQVAVRTNDPAVTEMTPLEPRQELKPVPYALHAFSATEATHATNADLAAKVAWGSGSLIGLPADFADGIDNDTTYSAGPGLLLSGTTFRVDPAYGVGNAWLLTGNSGTLPNPKFLGTTDNQPLDVRVNNQTAFRLFPASPTPNVIGGDSVNSFGAGRWGVIIGGGSSNNANGVFSSIVGGVRNSSGDYASVGGGSANQASGRQAVVAGGADNRATGMQSAIGGGTNNFANALAATISGGRSNTINAPHAAIGGGRSNRADGEEAVVAGGSLNTALAQRSAVGGGNYNFASGTASTIAGGDANFATMPYASIGGGHGNSASGQDAVVAGGSGNAATAGQSTVGGGTGNRAMGDESTVGGGGQNLVSGESANIGGGFHNTNVTTYGTIGGGALNFADGNFSTTIAGGFQNTVWGQDATIGGGSYNTAQADASIIAGGQHNYVGTNIVTFPEFGSNTNYARLSAILGGGGNRISSIYSAIGGGGANEIYGDYGSIFGGHGNVIGDSRIFYSSETSDSFIGGGAFNKVQTPSGVVVGGTGNNVSGFSSSILGGRNNLVEGTNAVALGGDYNHVPNFAHQSVVTGRGAVARTANSTTMGVMFDVPGDGQVANTVLKSTTVSTTYSSLFGPIVPASGAIAFRALITAKAFGDFSGAWEVRGLVRRYGSGTSFVGTPIKTLLGRDHASLEVTPEVVLGVLSFRVDGISGLNVRWVCQLETSEVVY